MATYTQIFLLVALQILHTLTVTHLQREQVEDTL